MRKTRVRYLKEAIKNGDEGILNMVCDYVGIKKFRLLKPHGVFKNAKKAWSRRK